MKKFFSVYACILFVLLFEGYFSLLVAGQVTLEIATTTSFTGSRATAGYKITNRGTDTAHDVSVLGQFLGEQQSVFIAERLGPGQSAESATSFHPRQNLQGSYPLFITISYAHADGISVASASLAEVKTGLPGERMLDAKADFKKSKRGGEVTITLKASDPSVEMVTITSHGPEDIAVDPPVQSVRLENGKGQAIFTVTNISGQEGSVYGLFFAAEYDTGNQHMLALADAAVPVEKLRDAASPEAETLHTALYAALLILAALLIIAIIISTSFRQWLFRMQNVPHLLDLLVLAAVEIFIFSKFDLASLLTATTTTGGDTASHYYTLEYLRHTLLPAGKISGWTMGNYAGFPILQFYFPLPFLIMCLLDLVMPLQVAFKLVTLLGTALLPAAAYTMLRLIRCPFPGPGIGAALMLPFLFNSANSMWGGNILSTLAGEFSYSLSMTLSLILIGSLYRGTREDKGIILNGILVFLVGFSHGYTLLFAEAMSLFLLVTPYGFVRRAVYLLKVYALGFCLLAFWLVPLLAFTKYTTSYHLVWTIGSLKEIAPEILFPVVVTGIAGSLLLLILSLFRYNLIGRNALPALAYLWFGLAAALVFFVAAPRIGVVDIRYVPYGQLMTCLMAALFLGWVAANFLARWGLSRILLIVLAAASIHWTDARLGPVRGWSKWNYEGFEAKKTWSLFERINKSLAGNLEDPRVVYEHIQDHNMFGSSRAFESLPLFAGRSTLEGLYMQASLSAPFVFYIQSMISQTSSQPFPQYNYTTLDFERARSYLKLFNVRDLIIKSRQAKQAIKQVPGYSLTQKIGQYEIWKLASIPNRYVELLQYEPVLYTGAVPWKQIAHQWFTRDELRDTYIVFNEMLKENDNSPFTLAANTLAEIPKQEIDISDCNIKETIKDAEILLETNCPGKPHLVKVSYHPNWHVEGAAIIYPVSPSFMLIYPNNKQVRLFYGPGPWDRLGQLITLFGLLVLLCNVPFPGKRRRTTWSAVANSLKLPAVTDLNFLPDPNPGVRKITLLTTLAAAVIIIAFGSYRTYENEPYRVYNRSIQHKDKGEYEQARNGFRDFIEIYPLSNLARESSYYVAITYYLEKNDQEALRAFEEYLKRYPQGNRVAEIRYHMGLVLWRSGKKNEGIRRMQLLIEKHPDTTWARYAKERLQEQGVIPSGLELNINSSNLNEYMGRAITYFNQEKLDEAKSILLEISERFPDFEGAPQALAALALCYFKEGNCLNAIKYYQKLIERYPGNKLLAEAYFHIGTCHERLGNKILADNAFRKVLALDPGGVFGKQAKTKVGR
ncbi:MAG: hypothetical protein AMJ61_11855 [Desulfobacterales bacterium SG8_35_2]|nr:MAG: hypothetical protein AMJ61_11855 [Desulfobacterales bacterium SG8_35_2]